MTNNQANILIDKYLEAKYKSNAYKFFWGKSITTYKAVKIKEDGSA